MSIKEDALMAFAKTLFGDKSADAFKTTSEKWFGTIEKILPAEGPARARAVHSA